MAFPTMERIQHRSEFALCVDRLASSRSLDRCPTGAHVVPISGRLRIDSSVRDNFGVARHDAHDEIHGEP